MNDYTNDLEAFKQSMAVATHLGAIENLLREILVCLSFQPPTIQAIPPAKPTPKTDSNLDMHLSELFQGNIRIINALTDAKILTLKQLTKISTKRLRSIDNLGPKSIKEVLTKLDDLGYKLKGRKY